MQQGHATTKDIEFTDTLSTGLDYKEGSIVPGNFGTDVSGAPTLVFTLPEGSAIGEHELSYTAIVNADAADEVNNAIVAEIGECENCEVIHPVSGVWVNKAASPAAGTSVRAGEEITYTLTVEVEGADTTKAVELTDTLGAGLTYVEGSAEGDGFIIDDSDPRTLNFTLPSGAAGGTDYTVTYRATVDADATVSVSNSVVVDSGGNCGDECVVTHPVSGLSVEKTNNLPVGTVVMDNDVLTYTITVTVEDSATSKPVVLTDTLGEGLEYVPGSASGAGFTTDTIGAPELIFTLEAPADPGVYELTYQATVAQKSQISVDNKVVPESDLPICNENCETSNPVSRTSTAKTSNIAPNMPIWVGDEITYTLTVTVEGDTTTKDLTLTDTLGSGLTYVEGSVVEGNFNADTSAAPVLTFVLPAGAEVGTHSVSYTVVVNEDVTTGEQSDVVNNVATDVGICPIDSCTIVIPIEPPDMDIEIVKTADIQVIRRGEQAPFTIRAINNGEYMARDVRVVDTIPAGFRYVDNSSTVNGVAQEPVIMGRQLVYEGIQIAAGSESVIRLRLQALSTATPGKHVNVAIATDPDGQPISPPGRAEFEILVEPVFDCGDVIGQVFDDRNKNGYQDNGEPGLPGVRVITAKGWIITTDAHGRWHVPCAMLPDQRIGSNFIAKIDERSLPTGYRLTTENPRVMRLTAGKMSEIDFGAAITRVVRLDLQDNAFIAKQTRLKPEWNAQLKDLISVLRTDPSVLRLSYYATAADLPLAKDRIKSLRENIVSLWRQSGAPYRLEIESSIEASK